MNSIPSKKLIFLITCMLGGGAERIMVSLANDAARKGYEVSFILTGQSLSDAVGYALEPRVHLLSLDDISDEHASPLKIKLMHLYGQASYRLSKRIRTTPPDSAVYCHFVAEQAGRIGKLQKIIKAKPDATVIAFLDHAIHLALLVMRDLPNKLIISERSDPSKHDTSKVASLFIKRYYDRADVVVFLTEGAKSYYSQAIQRKGIIIPNAVKEGLPERFAGNRKKTAVNFCRISHEKNLPLLIEAFRLFHEGHPDYTLEIIGEARDGEGTQVINNCRNLIREYCLDEYVAFRPFDPELHQSVRDYAMFVSSSDFEGMSNSMLEAMAIGLPTICTDCPAGGARAVIQDGLNGLLVKVGDEEALAAAMKRVADEPGFAETLSMNAACIADKLSAKRIMSKWESLY